MKGWRHRILSPTYQGCNNDQARKHIHVLTNYEKVCVWQHRVLKRTLSSMQAYCLKSNMNVVYLWAWLILSGHEINQRVTFFSIQPVASFFTWYRHLEQRTIKFSHSGGPEVLSYILFFEILMSEHIYLCDIFREFNARLFVNFNQFEYTTKCCLCIASN